jgi:hypothetical protein
MSRAEWALVVSGFLRFGLVILGSVLGLRWMAGAGVLLAGVAGVWLAAIAQRQPPQ